MANHKLSEQYESWKKSMTDYQFKHLLELIEKVDKLTHENDALRQQTIEMIYKVLEANFAAGKSPEEVLETVAALKDNATSPANPNN